MDLRDGAPRRRLGKKKIRDGKGEGVEEGRRQLGRGEEALSPQKFLKSAPVLQTLQSSQKLLYIVLLFTFSGTSLSITCIVGSSLCSST